jgi:uncharacterized repeat protein (TIGR04138 family)
MSSYDDVIESALEFDERLRAVARIDGRYNVEAYRFIFEGLQYTLSKLPEPRHVTAYELLDGIREFAKDKFGFMARTVFESWGLHGTGDFGQIVFSLVSYSLMGKTDEDNLEDFENVYDFKKVFDEEYIAELPRHVKLST